MTTKWHEIYIDGKNYDQLETESAIAMIEKNEKTEELYWEVWDNEGYLIESGLHTDLELTKEIIEEVIAQNVEAHANY
jgi:hypothetical protein